ncbi:hypothetical protein MR829_20825 [Paracoccus versutus]|uniref:hypothetical protein n=1 Tax=Paracoccus versutus TaxID=34007 RepID=UPI001FB85AC8|nr:hypothetical protein [Paracoccus versutus]MCJ1902794.1 hypothetical protein [Paracoccus versutus]
MQDAGHDMKARMRADLRAAMKEGRGGDARLIRTLIAALDNAEAPPARSGSGAAEQHRFLSGSAEIERLSLDADRVRAILLAEIEEREQAAAEMDRLDRPDRAEAIRAEVRLATGYLSRP